MVEPWLRGTLLEVAAIPRQILHALKLAVEDQIRWTSDLTESELHLRPFRLPSVGFQMRHMVRSLDRLLTYAEGGSLSGAQLLALQSEHDPLPGAAEEFVVGMIAAEARVMAYPVSLYEETRYVGREKLIASLGGLLVHCAEHTQRHAGQMVTTAKVVAALRRPETEMPDSTDQT